AAVEMVLTVVCGEFVFDPVQRKTTFGYAVAVASDDRAEVWIVLQVTVEIAEAEYDVVKLSIAIRNFERRDDGAVIHDLCFDAVRIAKCVKIDLLTVRRFAERLLRDLGVDGHRGGEK